MVSNREQILSGKCLETNDLEIWVKVKGQGHDLDIELYIILVFFCSYQLKIRAISFRMVILPQNKYPHCYIWPKIVFL